MCGRPRGWPGPWGRREIQKKERPERPRETQRDPEGPRGTQREPEGTRGNQREPKVTERPGPHARFRTPSPVEIVFIFSLFLSKGNPKAFAVREKQIYHQKYYIFSKIMTKLIAKIIKNIINTISTKITTKVITSIISIIP